MLNGSDGGAVKAFAFCMVNVRPVVSYFCDNDCLLAVEAPSGSSYTSVGWIYYRVMRLRKRLVVYYLLLVNDGKTANT